jgi:hypothetical protein
MDGPTQYIRLGEPRNGIFPLLVASPSGKVLLGYDEMTEQLVGISPPVVEPSGCEIANINQIPGYGQSNALGIQCRPPISTTQPYSNITFGGGPRSTGPTGDNPGLNTVKPLIEDTVAGYVDVAAKVGETPCSGMANTLSERATLTACIAPQDFVILASTAAHGGYEIAELQKGSDWYPLLLEHIAAGIALSPSSYSCPLVWYIQGERDAVLGSSYAYYLDRLKKLQRDIQADVRAITGQKAPVYLIVIQTAQLQTTTGAAIAQAQYQASLDVREIILAAPMYHLARFIDGLHLTAPGARQIGAYIGEIANSLIALKRVPQKWRCVAAVARGTTLKVKMAAPVLPLVIDTAALAATTNFGFKVQDAAGAVAIYDIAIEGDDIISMSLARALGSSPVLRYARDYMASSGPNIAGGASGNLRDGNPATVTLGGDVVPLWTPCPSFEAPIIQRVAPALQPFFVIQTDVQRVDLPSYNTATAAHADGLFYEEDAAGHWVFGGAADCLKSRTTAAALTIQGAMPVIATNYLTTQGYGNALISPFDDSFQQTICAVLQRPQADMDRIIFGSMQSSQKGSGCFGRNGTASLSVRVFNNARRDITWPADLAPGMWFFAALSEDFVNARTAIAYLGGAAANAGTEAGDKLLSDGPAKIALGNAYYSRFSAPIATPLAEFVYWPTVKSVSDLNGIYTRSKARMAARGIALY